MAWTKPTSASGSLLRHHRCPVLALLLCLYALVVESFMVPTHPKATATRRPRVAGAAPNSRLIRGSTVQAREPQVSSSTSTSTTSNPPSSPPAAQPPVVAPVIPQEALLPASFFQSLPWSRSINGDGPETLLYMPFLEAQMRHLEAHGGFVRELPIPESVSYTRAAKKASHMASFCVETEDFRKIRFTYMDGGKGLQVFNSVWYPRFDTDAPILGIDLLLFGGHKMLAVVDFQPLSQEEEYKERFISQLGPIKAKYPALSESMSNRYYEDTRWFSEHMLFGRLQETSQVESTLFPAFNEYMAVYSDTVRRSRGCVKEEERVVDRHRAYDEYQLIHDPAHGLFTGYFGPQFAHDMLTFQFDLADPALLLEQKKKPGMGGGGGNPHAQGGGGNPHAQGGQQQQQQQQGEEGGKQVKGGVAAAPIAVAQ